MGIVNLAAADVKGMINFNLIRQLCTKKCTVLKRSLKLKILQHLWLVHVRVGVWGILSSGISITKLFWEVNFRVQKGCFSKPLWKWLAHKIVRLKRNLTQGANVEGVLWTIKIPLQTIWWKLSPTSFRTYNVT
jgi:hypothetical protein